MGYWTKARRAAHPYVVTYRTAGEPPRYISRHRTGEAAWRAASRHQAALERHNPGGNLLCGYAVIERVDGEWRDVDAPE